ncbi:hypothetical protein [Sphingomonas oryzagri]|jgi:hypothetical protein|uniref:Uncharacterized protein n=1 Tax=Sphingomonas oryzagri TaxID=3042314 RepID=A0ABT6N4W2_9SPHN|nr:hypothetical protein [Sphingomonas oryzagri]MDH7640041.1 hypothetical protein [Sphingomonas oryzagri]
MTWLHLLSWFFGGLFLMNAVPHVVSGATGRPFQSPFATPPGEGLSSSTVNMLWGLFNLAVAYGLICHVGAFDPRALPDAAATGLGMVAIGLFSARHFGRFHGGDVVETP